MIFKKHSGVCGKISIFGHMGPKHQNGSNFSLDEVKKVVDGSLEAYRSVE